MKKTCLAQTNALKIGKKADPSAGKAIEENKDLKKEVKALKKENKALVEKNDSLELENKKLTDEVAEASKLKGGE